MNKETFEKIISKRKVLNGLKSLLDLEGSVSITLSGKDTSNECRIRTTVDLDRSIIDEYCNVLKQELKDLGFDEN